MRLLSWPIGIQIIGYDVLSGPRSAGAGASESLSGFVQTTSSPFGLWRVAITVEQVRGQAWRRFSGMVTALHGGANAVRVEFVPFTEYDAPIFPMSLAGVNWNEGVAPITDDKPWEDTGKKWTSGLPRVAVAAAAAKDTDTITLDSAYWGYDLGVGDRLGFIPLHFGLYVVTEVLSDPGQYRIWPPLRAALTTASRAVLNPVMAMRLASEADGQIQFFKPNTLTMIEVDDTSIRAAVT